MIAGIGTGSKSAHELIATIKANEEVLARWEQCEVLVIDEVSMLSRELFEKLEMIARCLKRNAKPFGGIQLILRLTSHGNILLYFAFVKLSQRRNVSSRPSHCE